jgi:hypothetical protein
METVITTSPVTVKQALRSQTTLLGQDEHCSVDPDQLTQIGRAIGHQVRIKRNDEGVIKSGRQELRG